MSDKESLIKDLSGDYKNFFALLTTLRDRDETDRGRRQQGGTYG